MTVKKLDKNFAPTISDINKIAYDVLSDLPAEVAVFVRNIAVRVEDFPDDEIEMDMGLESPFDLLTRFETAGKNSLSWVKSFHDEKYGSHSFTKQDTLYLYRRAILDYWCESGEDLFSLIKKAIIGEIGNQMGFFDDDIEFIETDFPLFSNKSFSKKKR